jgi:hypothetical protein
MELNLLTSALLSEALLSFSLLGLAQTSTGLSSLEAELTTAYKRFRQAVMTKDHEQMMAAMSRSGYMTMKNQGIKYKMDFPKDFFEGMGAQIHSDLDLTKIQILRALEKDHTGMLVILALKNSAFDPYHMGEERKSILFSISFIKEADVWKFDKLSPFALIEEEEATLLSNGDFSKLQESNYQPNGIVPVVPEEEAQPDYNYEAVLNIHSFGYEVEVILNGKPLRKTQGNSTQRTGVKKGENTIVINSKALEGAYDFKITISATKDAGSSVEVFSLKAEKAAPVITKTFQVNFE